MEFTRRYLPMEWEERWRKEKERRRSVVEEGGQAAKEDERHLRRIVAYNDAKMGLTSGSAAEAQGQADQSDTSTSSQDSQQDNKSQNTNLTLSNKAKTCKGYSYPEDVFKTVTEFRASSILTDLTLCVHDGNIFPAHSPVLAAVSSLVENRLKERDVERERGRAGQDGGVDTEAQRWSLCLGPEVDLVGLQAVLEFAYTGVIVGLNRDTAAQIQAAAQTLGVPRVLDLCAELEDSIKHAGGHKTEQGILSAEDLVTISFQRVKELWAERVGCDVVLEVNGASFYAHRVILAASSDYFRGMFSSGMRESHQTRVALPFLLASELKDLIGCSYTGVLLLSWDNVFEMSCTALQLQFQPALELCLDFMRREMDVSSCLDVSSFAEAYGMSDLLEEADDFMLRNFWEVSTTTSKFEDLAVEKLLGYLRSDSLCAPSELAVFRAVVAWVEADIEERIGLARQLMAEVRFPLMTFREFREVRAISLRMESGGDTEVELYSAALKEFAFSLPETHDRRRVRRPKDALVLVGGDQLNPDMGQRLPSRKLWFANTLRSGTGLVKEMEWRKLTEMPHTARFRHGVAVMNGMLFVAGGCDFYTKDDTMKSVYRYDPKQDIWQKQADMLEFRSNFQVAVRGERLYAIGGDRELYTNMDSVEVYNLTLNSWSYTQPLDRALSGHAVTVLNGEIFISGGFDHKYRCLASLLAYRPESGTSCLANMAQDRAQHCMETLCCRLYVAGGVRNLETFYTDQLACEVYDPASDSWSAFATLPVPHVGAASAVLEEKLYVLGGYSQEDYSESGLVHRYNVSLRRWENMGRLPGAGTDIRACLLRLPQHRRQLPYLRCYSSLASAMAIIGLTYKW